MWPEQAHSTELMLRSDHQRSRDAADRYVQLQAIRAARQRRRDERTQRARQRRPITLIQALLRG